LAPIQAFTRSANRGESAMRRNWRTIGD
jgi:hypothetical protein